MIYVSSSCVKAQTIKESIEILVSHGFRNIELSGGTSYYPEIEDDLLDLKSKYDLNYLCHNYFPPPQQDFVLNLASLDNQIYQKSLLHMQNLIELSSRLDAKQLGFHAGFFININANELGKAVMAQEIGDSVIATQRFCDAYRILEEHALKFDVRLYIENNVYALKNALRYNFKEVFMLTSFSAFQKLQSKIDFKPLVDLAHLKVSANVLKKDFHAEAEKFLSLTDYIHVSDNDGDSDLNWSIHEESEIYTALQNHNIQNKTITLEIYQSLEKIQASYSLLEGLIHD